MSIHHRYIDVIVESMYRTSELRLSKAPGNIPDLTRDKIIRLAAEKRVDVGSRIEMLQALAGYKWVGEASHQVSSIKPSGPTPDQQIAITLLNDMGLACSFDWLERSGKYFSWVQFAINQTLLDIFMDKEHPLNVFEEGAVYGYPVSSTLAFARIIPGKRVREKSVASYYLAGVNSEKYYDQESEHAERVWRHLCEIAPELTAEAAASFQG